MSFQLPPFYYQFKICSFSCLFVFFLRPFTSWARLFESVHRQGPPPSSISSAKLAPAAVRPDTAFDLRTSNYNRQIVALKVVPEHSKSLQQGIQEDVNIVFSHSFYTDNTKAEKGLKKSLLPIYREGYYRRD